MGFGGSVAAMITTLRNNRALLRSNKGFLSRARIGGLKKSYREAQAELAPENELSDWDRRIIRERIKRQYRRQFIRNTSLLLLIIVGLGFGAYQLNLYFQSAQQFQREHLEELQTQASESHYREAILNGDSYFAKAKYSQAMHHYLNALRAKPDQAQVAYKYALCCTLSCEIEKLFCDRVFRELEWLQDQFPKDQKIRKVIKDFETQHPELH